MMTTTLLLELDARKREASAAHREFLDAIEDATDADTIVDAARHSVEARQLVDAIDFAAHELRMRARTQRAARTAANRQESR